MVSGNETLKWRLYVFLNLLLTTKTTRCQRPEGPNLQHPDRPLMAHMNFPANTYKMFTIKYIFWKPIPVAARSKAWFFGRSLVGIAGSNLAGDMDGCLL